MKKEKQSHAEPPRRKEWIYIIIFASRSLCVRLRFSSCQKPLDVLVTDALADLIRQLQRLEE
jgi:hypothetical protein